MSNDNDMDALARQTEESQRLINELADHAQRTPPQSRLVKHTTLRLAAHSQIRGEQIIEVWCDGEFVGEITAADGCGVRIISKHEKIPRLFAPLILQVDIRR